MTSRASRGPYHAEMDEETKRRLIDAGSAKSDVEYPYKKTFWKGFRVLTDWIIFSDKQKLGFVMPDLEEMESVMEQLSRAYPKATRVNRMLVLPEEGKEIYGFSLHDDCGFIEQFDLDGVWVCGRSSLALCAHLLGSILFATSSAGKAEVFIN